MIFDPCDVELYYIKYQTPCHLFFSVATHYSGALENSNREDAASNQTAALLHKSSAQIKYQVGRSGQVRPNLRERFAFLLLTERANGKRRRKSVKMVYSTNAVYSLNGLLMTPYCFAGAPWIYLGALCGHDGDNSGN